MGRLLRWMERTTDRLNELADDNERWMRERAGVHQREPRRSVVPDPERATPRVLTEDDVNGFLAASGQRPEPGGTSADEFMRRTRLAHPRRLRRLERDLEWLRTEARHAGVPAHELGDVP